MNKIIIILLSLLILFQFYFIIKEDSSPNSIHDKGIENNYKHNSLSGEMTREIDYTIQYLNNNSELFRKGSKAKSSIIIHYTNLNRTATTTYIVFLDELFKTNDGSQSNIVKLVTGLKRLNIKEGKLESIYYVEEYISDLSPIPSSVIYSLNLHNLEGYYYFKGTISHPEEFFITCRNNGKEINSYLVNPEYINNTNVQLFNVLATRLKENQFKKSPKKLEFVPYPKGAY